MLVVKPSFESGCRRCSSAIPRSTSAGTSISICTHIKRERRERERERRVEGERERDSARERESKKEWHSRQFIGLFEL